MKNLAQHKHDFPDYILVSLPAEGAALREPSLSSSGLAEDSLAARAHHNSLGVAENSGSAKQKYKIMRPESMMFRSESNTSMKISNYYEHGSPKEQVLLS